MSDYFILNDNKEPIPIDNVLEWARSFEGKNRDVAKTKIGDVLISTVFLGLDHSFGHGRPLLFETMVFGGKLDQEMDRYSTWNEAEKGHATIVMRVKAI